MDGCDVDDFQFVVSVADQSISLDASTILMNASSFPGLDIFKCVLILYYLGCNRLSSAVKIQSKDILAVSCRVTSHSASCYALDGAG